jgi:circadian clock protein KaiC
LFLDGIAGLERLAVEPERVVLFMTAVSNELRGLGVTALFTDEADLLGPGDLPLGGLRLREASGLSDSVVVMRFVELGTRLERVISVLKVRDSNFQHRLRGYTIAAGGIAVDADSARAEAILAEALGQRVREG